MFASTIFVSRERTSTGILVLGVQLPLFSFFSVNSFDDFADSQLMFLMVYNAKFKEEREEKQNKTVNLISMGIQIKVRRREKKGANTN